MKGFIKKFLFLFLLYLFCSYTERIEFPGNLQERVVVAIEGKVRTLDPRFTIDSISMKVSRLIFSSLISVDNSSLQPFSDLASEIKRISPTLYEIVLKKGIKFHDGVELKAKDVVLTYKSILSNTISSPYHYDFKRKIKNIEEDKTEPLKLKIEVYEPYATFLTDQVMGILPSHLLDENFKLKKYIGTGPFKLHFISEDGSTVILERFEDYYGKKPSYKYLIVRAIEDENTRLLSLLAGSVDIGINVISPIMASFLKGTKKLKVQSEPSISWTYLLLNLRNPILADIKVRKAICKAIAYNKIIEERFRGFAIKSTGMLAAFHWAYNPDVHSCFYEPENSKNLLESAGYKNGITLTLKVSNNPFRREVAEDIVYYLKKVKIDVKMRSYELSTFLFDVRKGNFDIALLQLPEPIEPDMYHWMFYSMNIAEKKDFKGSSIYAKVLRTKFNPFFYEFFFFPHPICTNWAIEIFLKGLLYKLGFQKPSFGNANRTYYFNPLVDCFLDKARMEENQELRKKYYYVIQKIIAEELPVIPLWHENHIVVMNERIKGLKMLPSARLTPLVDIKIK